MLTTQLRHPKALLILVAVVALVFAGQQPLQAQQPGVWRTFAVVDAVEPLDFTDEDSVLIKAELSHSGPVTKFLVGFEGVPDGTPVVFGSPAATYITKTNGRTDIGSFAWVLLGESPEPPPVGSVSLTGPDAVLVQKYFNWYDSGNYIYPTGDTSESVMIIVTALFTR